jgi:pimeloyl-ACP methyl ester carboxylesterase
MKALLRPVAGGYQTWMLRWENELCFRSTDRVVRPFEYGIEWSRNWPLPDSVFAEAGDPERFLASVNREVLAHSAGFFGYDTPAGFELSEDNWLSFRSPAETPYPENNVVRAQWFPARNDGRRAVVVLPHWNSKLPQHVALCAGLQRLGVSALRLSLPYHDARMPAELSRADYAVSSNICRTIDATRQAVIDTRACFDWLQERGYERLGIIGTSLGSCYAFLAAAHDERIRTCVFNHCSTYFADVVWEGLSTRHIRQGLEGHVSLEKLRSFWLCISPPSYYPLFTSRKARSKFIYTRFDTTFPVHLSRQVIEGARKHRWDHAVSVLPCGHYTMGEFPFKFITGFEICSFLKRNL